MRNNREISFSTPSICVAKSITLFVLILLSQRVLGQFADNFSDGDFSTNPAWSGNASVFTINASLQLQLNNSVAATSYLSVPFTLNTLDEINWEFFIRQSFAPSSGNYGRVYLVSDQANLTGSLNGYYLQFGEAGTLDAIELFKQTGTIATSVCRAANGRIATSVTARVKVSRDATGLWRILVDYNGGTAFVEEASAIDITYTSSGFLGVACVYTSTNANKFFFDDFSINPFVIPDITPPIVETVSVQSSNQLSILFSEAIDQASAQTLVHYSASNGIGNPTSASLQANTRTVLLSFPQDFPNGVGRLISVEGIIDLAGNIMAPAEKEFMYFNAVPAVPNDIIITEIFADPAPSVGLPEVEFLEIFNRSANPFNLNGWKITDGSSTGTLTSFILLPDHYLILAPASSSSQFMPYGNIMGLTIFPTLNNSGDAMVLLDANGTAVNSVNYSSAWYGDVDKQGGGYTLERIDPEDFCEDSENWSASNNPAGGTPGIQNSVFEVTPDIEGPKMISCAPLNLTSIELTFDERLFAQVPVAADFSIQPSLTISSIVFSDGLLKKLSIEFAQEIHATTVYTIVAQNIFDCPGNAIRPEFNSAILKLDNTAPRVTGVMATNAHQVLIEFSEPLDPAVAFNLSSYTLSGDDSHPQSVSLIAGNVYALDFQSALANGIERTLTISGMTDLSQNALENPVQTFLYFVPQPVNRNDIVITELFPDPAPTVGLPEAEFIEFFNRSANPVQLRNWYVTDGTSAGLFPDMILLPNQYLIVAPAAYASALSPFGRVVGVSPFPSLNNSGDAIVLKDSNGNVIDSVRYASSWFPNDDTRDGGWTLERIDPEDFCLEEENWSASIDQRGGTPGSQNSIFAVTPDLIGPKLLSCAAVGDAIIELEFDEKLQPALPGTASFSITPNIGIGSVEFTQNASNKLQLLLMEPISATTAYTINVQSVFDCPGNLIQSGFTGAILKLDDTNPSVTEVEVLTANELRIKFSEAVDVSVLDPLNYTVSLHHPMQVVGGDDGSYVVRFDFDFTNGEPNTLFLEDIQDLAGNVLEENQYAFRYFVEYPSHYKDVIVTEIMADQSPSIDLPEAEFIEIYNRGQNPVDLLEWTIADDGEPVSLGSYILLPKRYLILCTTSQAQRLSSFGNVLGVANFPSLNNSGDYVVLKDREGVLIDSVHYDVSWYKDQSEQKKDGGWTLEIIDPENICAEKENWTASEDVKGGTPGVENSVFAEKPDLTSPTLIKVVAQTPDELLVTFGEKLDRAIPIFDRFAFEPSLAVAGIDFADAALTTFRITLTASLSGGLSYTVTVNNIFDCSGNEVDPNANTATFALPERAESTDVVVNEILFNPTSTGVDFIEIFNRSEKYINLKDWKLASDDAGEIVNFKTVSEEDLLLAPHRYLVFTENSNLLMGEYMNGVEGNFIQTDIPSLPDAEGSVVMLDEAGSTIDFMTYREEYHSVFIQEDEGISLERLNAAAESLDRDNWKSASTAVRATPGYVNSNEIPGASHNETIVVNPEVFVPSVGQPSFTTITYKFDRPGYVGSLSVFDSNGNEVKTIARNELLSAEGFFRWDGDRNDGTKARIGSYLIHLEVFDATGVVKTYRRRVVVSTRF
jgi:hypothetical protein